MIDEQTKKTTVSSNKLFFEELMDTYPAANSLSQAVLMAAQDGLRFQKAVENDLQTYIRETVTDQVRDELENSDVLEPLEDGG